MSNPFKTGDKLVQLEAVALAETFDVVTVTEVEGDFVRIAESSSPSWWCSAGRFRAAIAGQDYDVPKREIPPPDASTDWDRDGEGAPAYTPELVERIVQQVRDDAYAGHLPDGSSVQAHSAGPLYPVVLVWRDKKLGGTGKYDVGIISPRNDQPIWMSSFEAAVEVASLIKENIK